MQGSHQARSVAVVSWQRVPVFQSEVHRSDDPENDESARGAGASPLAWGAECGGAQ